MTQLVLILRSGSSNLVELLPSSSSVELSATQCKQTRWAWRSPCSHILSMKSARRHWSSRTSKVRRDVGALFHLQQVNLNWSPFVTRFTHISKQSWWYCLVRSHDSLNQRVSKSISTSAANWPIQNTRSSGAGDHGTDGILTFVEQHKCDLLCRGLDMPSLEQDKSQPGSTLQ